MSRPVFVQQLELHSFSFSLATILGLVRLLASSPTCIRRSCTKNTVCPYHRSYFVCPLTRCPSQSRKEAQRRGCTRLASADCFFPCVSFSPSVRVSLLACNYFLTNGGGVKQAGILIFAFSQGRAHWIGPVIGLVFTFTGIFTICKGLLFIDDA